MGLLALYDTVSIQSFIYKSNRLRDNQGASHLVSRCFTDLLPRAVARLTKQKVFKNVNGQWEEEKEAGFLQNRDVDCEIIYIGGGNALLYLKEKEAYRKLNMVFSEMLLDEMPGLTVVSETVSPTDNFGADMDRLFKRLQMKKYRTRGMDSAPCLSITRECTWTRKPAVAQGKDGTWISSEIVKKREASEREIREDVYKELKDLAGKEGEQWAAVVHIDGNDMGENIKRLLNGTSYEEGIRSIREFSIKIQELYTQAYETMKRKFAGFIEQSSDSRLDAYRGKADLPFRKIYGAGDDLTFICYAPLAIKAAEHFLKELSALKEKVGVPADVFISACGGIVFMKPGFPFAKAYELAEECCKTAKQKAREDAKQRSSLSGHAEAMGNYIDFHVVHGGLRDLEAIRKSEYLVRSGEVNWNLLKRPYEVMCKGKDSLDIFYLISDWIEKSKVARSKLKELRGVYYEGEQAAADSIARLRRRYQSKVDKLLEELEKQGVGIDRQSSTFIDNDGTVVLWDALEMMDLYIGFSEEGEA